MSMTVFELLEKLNQNPIGKEFLETAKSLIARRNMRLFSQTFPHAAALK